MELFLYQMTTKALENSQAMSIVSESSPLNPILFLSVLPPFDIEKPEEASTLSLS